MFHLQPCIICILLHFLFRNCQLAISAKIFVEFQLRGVQIVPYCQLLISVCCLLAVVSQGSAERPADNSLRPDTLSLSIAMQQSVSTTCYSIQSVPCTRSSAPVYSTAGEHRTGYSAAADLPVSMYSWSSQTLSSLQRPFVYASGSHVTEGASQLYGPTAVQSVADEPSLARPGGWPASEAEDDSRLAVVPSRDHDCDETEDESSVLSLSVNRLVSLTCVTPVLLPPPRKICNRRCLSVCLFVCSQLCAKTAQWICIKFSERVGNGPVNK